MRNQFNDALKDAMRRRDEIAVSTLRLVLAAVKDRDIAARTTGNTAGIEDGQIVELLRKMIRQREESIALYEKGGRQELAERERREIDVIAGFLPAPMSEADTAAAVESVIAEIGAETIKDMGRVMAELRTRYAGRMDFAKASAVAKARFS